MTDFSTEPGAWRVNMGSYEQHAETPPNAMPGLQWIDTSQTPWRIMHRVASYQDNVIALVDPNGWCIAPPAE